MGGDRVSSVLGIVFFAARPALEAVRACAARAASRWGRRVTAEPTPQRPAGAAPVVQLAGVDKVFARGGRGRDDGARRASTCRSSARRVRLAHRAVGLRQVDAAARSSATSSRRPRGTRRGQRQARAAGAPRPRLRDGLPGPGPVRLADGRGQRQAAARDRWARRPSGAKRAGRRRCSSSSSSATSCKPLPVAAVGRDAAARGDRPRPRLRAGDPADGRAVRRARRDDPRADEPGGAARSGRRPARRSCS